MTVVGVILSRERSETAKERVPVAQDAPGPSASSRLRMTLIVLLFASSFSFAQTEPKPAPEPEQKKPPAESALVKAARETKKTRKSAKGKVITNADVKKSKGKLIVLPGDGKPAAPAGPVDPRSTLEKYEDRKKARQKAEEVVAAAEKKVRELEQELLRLEQAFYDANDPNHRDQVIHKRFEQIRRQLDEAKKELADARDAASAIDQPTS